jgi:hypothetical protein
VSANARSQWARSRRGRRVQLADRDCRREVQLARRGDRGSVRVSIVGGVLLALVLSVGPVSVRDAGGVGQGTDVGFSVAEGASQARHGAFGELLVSPCDITPPVFLR